MTSCPKPASRELDIEPKPYMLNLPARQLVHEDDYTKMTLLSRRLNSMRLQPPPSVGLSCGRSPSRARHGKVRGGVAVVVNQQALVMTGPGAAVLPAETDCTHS